MELDHWTHKCSGNNIKVTCLNTYHVVVVVMHGVHYGPDWLYERYNGGCFVRDYNRLVIYFLDA